MLIEFPIIQEIGAEFARAASVKAILRVLKARFGAVTPTIAAGLEQVKEEERLNRLTDYVGTCPDLPAFEEALRKELPAPPPVSTRGKRKPRKPSEG
jgi:hypothetical protein